MRGLYEIINKENNRVYVGESLNITNRWKDHIKMLKNNTHYNYKLQEDFNKYGERAFEFKIHMLIDENISNDTTKYLLLELERSRINFHKKYNTEIYNLEDTLDALMTGKRNNRNFNKKEFLKTKDDLWKQRKYCILGNVIMKKF